MMKLTVFTAMAAIFAIASAGAPGSIFDKIRMNTANHRDRRAVSNGDNMGDVDATTKTTTTTVTTLVTTGANVTVSKKEGAFTKKTSTTETTTTTVPALVTTGANVTAKPEEASTDAPTSAVVTQQASTVTQASTDAPTSAVVTHTFRPRTTAEATEKPMCCKALTANCMACTKGVSVEAYCKGQKRLADQILFFSGIILPRTTGCPCSLRRTCKLKDGADGVCKKNQRGYAMCRPTQPRPSGTGSRTTRAGATGDATKPRPSGTGSRTTRARATGDATKPRPSGTGSRTTRAGATGDATKPRPSGTGSRTTRAGATGDATKPRPSGTGSRTTRTAGSRTTRAGATVKPVLQCPAANCKVYFDGCNTCQCGADGTLKRCAKKNTCAGDTPGQAKCRKSYPAPKTTRAPFAGSTDITCRGRNPDPKVMGSMTHIGTLDGCKRQANELNIITTACGAKSGSFVCRTKASEVENEFFVGFQGSIRECKARTKALTKGIAKFDLGTKGAKKVKFSCSGSDSDTSVVFKRGKTCETDSKSINDMVALFVAGKFEKCRKQ